MLRSSIAAAALVAALCPCLARAALLDPAFSQEVFITLGNVSPTGMAWAPDGSNRLFWMRQGGQVRIVENRVLLPTPFATLSPIQTTSECGLIGMAFSPNYANDHYVYFFVTVSTTEQQIIRFTDNGNVGADKTTIISGLPTRGANHDGGALGFGGDGKLYWAVGDNGNARGVDLDLLSLGAKVGRANPDGSVPNDNPFYDGDGPNNDYIWARGFRNPFTMTFQPKTDRLWLTVVGSGWEQVFAPLAGDHGGWNNYQSNQPASYLAPIISYRTNGSYVVNVTGAVRQGGVATFTTNMAHRNRPGARITVAGVADPSFDATGYITQVDSPTSFAIAQPGANASSSGGTAASQQLGGAPTGGTFWESTAIPAAMRGNFFFGDYNSGRLMRATLDAQNHVTSVDEWGNGFQRPIDADVGPDGDLYVVNFTGTVFHISHNATSQALVVSRRYLRGPEGGKPAFNVRLARVPSRTIDVQVVRSAGDVDVTVEQGGALTFDASNWSVPQAVHLSLLQDLDSVDDEATIRATASGLTAQDVTVRVTDDDATSLLLSSGGLTVDEGSSGTFDVWLSEPPGGPLTVQVGRSSGDGDVAVSQGATLSFDSSNWSDPQTVTVSAAQDADTVEDLATVTVSASGLSSRDVMVTVTDDDDSAPLITSTPVSSAVVGAEYRYDVEATGLPVPAFALDQGPPGMTVDPVTGLVSWTPDAVGVADVTVRAANGVAPDATQDFDIDVVADLAPNCVITAPQPGATLSGAIEEFFGDVFDDVGAVRAEFSVDGNVEFTDVGSEGHYHFGGSHNLFDTTAFADGPHVLRMTGYDTAGQTCEAEVSVSIDNTPDGEGGAAGAGTAGAAGTPDAAGGAAGESTGEGGSTGGTSAGAGQTPDAGSIGGEDAGTTSDRVDSAGGGGGCGCRLQSTRDSGAVWVFAGLIAGVLRRRRRRPA